ncbi:MAG: hypothetical protein WC538_16445 [Thermoanaerobaculia bacterium]
MILRRRTRFLLGLAQTVVLLATACASAPVAPSSPGRLSLHVTPNPIVATPLDGDAYRFDFVLEIREEGGSDVSIDRVSADVLAFGGLRIASRKMNADEIARRGYATSVRAGNAIRYAISQQHDVPDDRLLDAVKAELLIEGTDALGNRTTARATVGVVRGEPRR